MGGRKEAMEILGRGDKESKRSNRPVVDCKDGISREIVQKVVHFISSP